MPTDNSYNVCGCVIGLLVSLSSHNPVGISEEGMAEFVLNTVINGILRLCLSSLGAEKCELPLF